MHSVFDHKVLRPQSCHVSGSKSSVNTKIWEYIILHVAKSSPPSIRQLHISRMFDQPPQLNMNMNSNVRRPIYRVPIKMTSRE